MYDENDGFFDHMVPPTPPQSRAEGLSTVDTTNEIFPGNAEFAAGPYGLGVRVPMIVDLALEQGRLGGSEVFDHTSLIRFIERRFGHGTLRSRRDEHHAVAARRGRRPDVGVQLQVAQRRQSSRCPARTATPRPTAIGTPITSRRRRSTQSLPEQEPGMRPARPVPYELHVRADVDAAAGTVTIHFGNSGSAAAVFQVRRGQRGRARGRTPSVRQSALSDTWQRAGKPGYGLSVYGPNGFFRSFKGSLTGHHKTNLAVSALYEGGGIALEIRNSGTQPATVHVHDAYGHHNASRALQPGEGWTHGWSLDGSHGWYDLTVSVDGDSAFQQQLAGHVETGDDSMTDPALG